MRREERIVGGGLRTCEGPSGKETVNKKKDQQGSSRTSEQRAAEDNAGFEPFCTAMGSH